MNTHICDDECTKGDRLKGMKFACNECEKEVYFDSAAEKFDKVFDLLTIIGIIKTVQGAAKANIEHLKQCELNTIVSVFGNDSPLFFRCGNCMNIQSKYIDKLKNEIEKMKLDMKEKDEMIQQLTDESERPDNFNEHSKWYDENEIESIANNLSEKVTGLITSEFAKITKKTQSSDNVQVIGDTQQKTTDGTNEMGAKGMNPFRSNVPRSKEVSFDAIPHANKESRWEKNVGDVKFSDKLKQTNETQQVNNDVYTIHVSKFPLDTTNDDITQHIMNNTDIIHDEAFKVERLNSKASDYVSFKISTLSKHMYLSIMSIWEPLYKARDFVQLPNIYTPKRKPTTHTANRYNEHADNYKMNRLGDKRAVNKTPNRKRFEAGAYRTARNEANNEKTPTKASREKENKAKQNSKEIDNNNKQANQQFILVPMPQQQMPFLGHQIYKQPMQLPPQLIQQPMQQPLTMMGQQMHQPQMSNQQQMYGYTQS